MLKYLYTLDYETLPPETPQSESAAIDDDIPSEEALSPGEDMDNEKDNKGNAEITKQMNDLSDPLFFHIAMFSLADRRMIDGLKALCKEKFEPQLRGRLDGNSISAAFPALILDIYTSTPPHERGLRDVAVKMTIKYLPWLRRYTLPAAFSDDLLDMIPQFARDLLVGLIDRDLPLIR